MSVSESRYELQDSALHVTADRQGLSLRCRETGASVRLHVTCPVLALRKTADRLEYELPDGVRAVLFLDEDHALVAQLHAPQDRTAPLLHPFAARTQPGQKLLLTIDEGVCLPVEEQAELLSAMRGCCSRECTMPFTAALLPGHYFLTVLDTEWDAGFQLCREENGLLHDTVYWLSSLGQWRYDRQLRYYFAPGQITQACKRFRAYRSRQGLVVTLRQKQQKTPALDRLVGAANVWLWHDEYEKLMYANTRNEVSVENTAQIEAISAQMRESGMEHIVWGIFFGADAAAVPTLQQDRGYLCARYDCLTDVPPEEVLRVIPQNRIENCDYTVRRMKDYPDGIALDGQQQPRPAWALPGTDGKMHPQNKLCPSRMPLRLREELPECRKDGCRARFIDVMGVETYECFHPEHPVSRRESVELRQQCFDEAIRQGLVVGTEDGFDRLAAQLHYNEGMMSPVFFRYQYENAGRMKALLYGQDAAEWQDRYLLNPAYRVPLWELVYHDCVASYWYWGDSSCCCVERMHKKDLWNILYGTAPMYSLRSGNWSQLRERIVASYHAVTAVARRVGYCEMTDFTWLREDAGVQQSTFSDGTVVIVNFSDSAYEAAGKTVPADDYLVIHNAQAERK